MDFEGNFNHAIMIRTFLLKSSIAFTSRCWNRRSSDEESEMEEVYNKLRALNKALDVAK
jgi:anthranilate synthase component 1